MRWLTISVVLGMLSGCSDKSKENPVLASLQSSLINSTSSIHLSTETILKSLEEKTTDYKTKERADYWYPKAIQAVAYSSAILDHINAAEKTTGITADQSKEIFSQLLKYKKDLLNIDSSIREVFESYFVNFPNKQDSTETSNENSFFTTYFKHSTRSEQSAILAKFQNDIVVMENKIIAFCNTKVGFIGDFFTFYSPVIGQSSGNLKPGEELEITAGIGAFSNAAQPKIIINGREIKLGDEGHSLYKIKVPQTPGNYSVPVKISYFNQAIGKDYFYETTIKYTVAEPCN